MVCGALAAQLRQESHIAVVAEVVREDAVVPTANQRADHDPAEQKR